MKREDVNEDWKHVTQPIAARIRASGIGERGVVKTEEGEYFAPLWAKVFAEVPGVSERSRSAALRRASFDALTGAVANTIIGLMHTDKEKADYLERVVADNINTLICQCGWSFETVPLYLEHKEGCK